MEQLDDVTAVKDDVISAGHAALHHDPVPARHLKHKRTWTLVLSVFYMHNNVYL